MRWFSLNQHRLAIVMTVLGAALIAGGGAGGANAQPCACQLPAAASGVVHSVSGNVFMSQTTGIVPAQPSMHLGAGDVVLVGLQSSSIVAFEGCGLRLLENTTFEVQMQNDFLCLAVSETIAAPAPTARIGRGGGEMWAPLGIAAGAGLGALAFISSGDVVFSSGDDRPVSK